MIASLYEPFRKWSETGSVWIISDPHFEDEDSKLMNPNWIEPQEHIDILNKSIYKNDTLICLGDCGDLSWFRKIKANYKVLIMGNHCTNHGSNFYKKTKYTEIYDADQYSKSEVIKIVKEKHPDCKFTIFETYDFHMPFNRYQVNIDDNLFDEVYDGALFISDRIVLSHEPIYGLPFAINIHGHVHNGQYSYLDEHGCKHINLASDVTNWQPFNLGKEIKDGLLSGIPTIHRLTIDRAIENPIHKN